MKEWIVKYWLEILFALIAAGIGAAYRRLAKKVKKQVCDQRALKNGMLALLRSEIIRCHDKYIQWDWIPIYALESVLALYNAYSALGGNGTVTKLVEDLKALTGTSNKDGRMRTVDVKHHSKRECGKECS